MEDSTKASSAPSLADGPTATQVTFHGSDGSATVWVDPVGHVQLTAEQVRFLADHRILLDRATIAEAAS